jgi:plastocyanin
MEKVGTFKTKILFLLGLFFAALAFSAAMPVAEAGTLFARPEPVEKLSPGESYAESSFGRPPARGETGINDNYASRAVNEMETSDEEVVVSRSSSRSLASTGGASGETRQHLRMSMAAPDTAPVEPASAMARKGVQEVAVIASDLGFFPKTVFVSRDVPVRLFVTGSSKNTLCIMMDSFHVRKQVRSQKIEEVTFTPNVPGKYRYYCPVNGMEGTLIVKEFATNVETGGGSESASAQSVSDQVGHAAAAPSRIPAGE